MGRIDGKVALITGAARGTGERTARLFAAEGARVLIADVLDDLGRSLAASIGPTAEYLHLDVTSPEAWQAAIATCKQNYGGLDVLVNNAGVLLIKSIEDTELAEFERVLSVNQVGPFLGIKHAGAAMKEWGGGSIINVSSIDGLRGRNGLVAYIASKWAVRGITRVAALELGRHGIRVNAVCPEAGSAEMVRPFVPAGADMEAVMATQQPYLATQAKRTINDRIDDVARMILFLASDDSASCTGGDFVVDGGNSAGRVVRGLPGS